ncbi:DNA-processing protein DprA [Paraglaciecola hydrolytica]|uniref:DNA processing protein DprA n=1 Tax=Paraglaciecola hydrolytica TaxID=1799789 RepID=A0A136A4F9_9ALTE|nr:DNA-processing protein DprA [Paraglaciecola hydrolytica]KXI30010.1 DNA processing protein DprA [Paraglaciecola hydrolytica]
MQQDVDLAKRLNKTDELFAWLHLASIPKFGAASYAKICKKLQWNISDFFTATQAELIGIGFNPVQVEAILHPNVELIQQSIQWLNGDNNRFVLNLEDSVYPLLLKEISSPPILLFGYGDQNKLANLQMAIVGSRNPSISGKEYAKSFAHDLSQCGWTITSGLALGIDGFSHEGAIQAKGPTIAVLGTGIDNIYPRKHRKLAEDIIAGGGVIISEFAPLTPVLPENFPRRNRIISGLSRGTLIVEAALKSGSLITARYATEQNREVFAIPGNINNPLTKGCHYLIQQGAKLVTCIADINEEFSELEFNIDVTNSNKTKKNSIECLATDLLLDSVDFEATPLDIVAERSGMTVSEVMSQLLEYELRGLVTAVPGGYIKLGEK